MKEFELHLGEQVVRETRKHWFMFLAELLPYAILAILPFALPNFLALAPPLAPFAERIDFALPEARAALGIWLLIVWTSAWGRFTRYYLNLWVLTNERIVNVKQVGYFDREVSSLFLNRIQDVTTDIEGVLPSLLNIGTINVQSAGATEKFYMHDIPRPTEMRDLILKYVPEGDSQPTGI